MSAVFGAQSTSSSSSSSTKWYPLPEVSSEATEEPAWWQSPELKTSAMIRDELTPQPQAQICTEPTTLSLTNTSVLDQSTQAADLTITSLLTASPPKQSEYTPRVNDQVHHTPPNQPAVSEDSLSSHHGSKRTHSSVTPNSSTSSFHGGLSSPRLDHMQAPPQSNPQHTPKLNSTTSSSSIGSFPIDVTALTQQISLLELDKLWHKFLTSSLLCKGKESIPATSKQRCTLGASYTETVSTTRTSKSVSVGTQSSKRTTSTISHSPSTSDHAKPSIPLKAANRVDRSVQTSQDDLPTSLKPPATFTIPVTHTRKEESVEPPKQPSIPHTRHHPPAATGASPILDKQSTDPTARYTNDAHVLPVSEPVSRPPPKTAKRPVSFHIPHSNSRKPPATPNAQPSPTIYTSRVVQSTDPVSGFSPKPSTISVLTGPLSLPEAFALQRPDFIVRSQRRERRVREMGNVRVEQARKRLPSSWERNKTAHPQTICSSCKAKQQSAAPTYYQMVGHGARPRMGHRRMYRVSKRVWDNLPEVKRKAEEERKHSQAETNRLRVKLYQKEVLARMRKRVARHQ